MKPELETTELDLETMELDLENLDPEDETIDFNFEGCISKLLNVPKPPMYWGRVSNEYQLF